MSWAVQEIYAAVWDGRIATAGGLKSVQGQPLHIEDRLALFDPSRMSWSEGPRLPAPRHHPMMVASGETLWAIGGYGRSDAGEWTNAAEVWSLTPGATAWADGPALPVPQAEAVGLSHAGRGGQRRLERSGRRRPASGAARRAVGDGAAVPDGAQQRGGRRAGRGPVDRGRTHGERRRHGAVGPL
jgi:hypothetical protein